MARHPRRDRLLDPTAIVLAAGLLAGYLAAWGRPRGDAVVSTLATGQRNLGAAVVIAFSLGGDVVVLTLVAAIVTLIVVIVLGGELGRQEVLGILRGRPSNHSAEFAPTINPTIDNGVTCLMTAARVCGSG